MSAVWDSRGRKRRKSRCLSLEPLETRRLLAVTVDIYPLLTKTFNPIGVTDGPDGNIWFTEPYTNSVGFINPSTHAVAEFALSTTSSGPLFITTGGNGHLWFTAQGPAANSTGSIGEIDPVTHVITAFPLPTAGARPSGITAGGDGNLWFTEPNVGKIGEINETTGAITEFPLPNANSSPGSIVAAPDGNIYFTFGAAYSAVPGSLGEINPTTHAITAIPLPTLNSGPGSITVGPDGNLWFFTYMSDPGATRPPLTYITNIDQFNLSSRAITEYPSQEGLQLTSGPDGNLWFSGFDYIGQFNLATHSTTIFDLPYRLDVSPFADPGIVTGPDGALWFPDGSNMVAARIIPATQSAISSTVVSDPSASGLTTGAVLAGKTVYLDLRGDGTLDPGNPTAVTNAYGYYTFTGLAPGTYQVRVLTYPGEIVTSPAGGGQSLTVTGGQLGAPTTFAILSGSSLLPLTLNSAPFGSNNPDVSTAEVNGLYQLILGRAPDASGGSAAVSYLKNGGSLSQLASDLLTSVEYDSRVVASYYQNFLGRAPDPSGGAASVALLHNGGSLDDLATDLLTSPEFRQIHGSSSDYVQALYNDILGRVGAPSEIAVGAALVNSDANRVAVVHGLLASTEAVSRTVVGAYAVLLARAVGGDELSPVISYFQQGGTEVGLATILTSSPEFISRANATVG